MFCAVFAVCFTDCAKVGTPMGGPQDKIPPQIVSSEPANYKSNFSDDRLEITFDEFVTIRNLSSELIVSPPLKERPTMRMRGKAFILNLNNELRDSITYTFNFGSAITDFHEGNVLLNYEFVVSTGDFLDSLSLTGRLLQAHDLQPGKDPALVMMYSNLNDSAPLQEIPLYLGKTGKEGDFTINNIKTGTYRIFALKDVNNNMIYDLPDESIAFSDSAFVFDPRITDFSEDIIIDTSRIAGYVDSTMFSDSLFATFVVDSITGDTINIPQKLSYALHINLYLFNEMTTVQYITDKERHTREKIFIAFNRPPFDSVTIEPLSFGDETHTLLKEVSAGNDSIVLWITDTSIVAMDTLLLKVSYSVYDSLHRLTRTSDTLNLRFRERKPEPERGRKSRKDREEEVPETEYLGLQLNLVPNGSMDLNRLLTVTSPRPVFDFDSSRMHLYSVADSVDVEESFHLLPDSARVRRFAFRVNWKEGMKYHLYIDPGAFTDIYGMANDTIDMHFTTRFRDYYGKIILSLGENQSPFLIHLLDDKDKIVATGSVTGGVKTVFDYLYPGNYRLKAIRDMNRNSRWDTGKYLENIQPEKVWFYPEKIELRSNWDIDLSWDIR
ncbi:MAG: Ig-like domain-containing protein [Bacteroidales bacterium]|nr:Ig-like domain-containing protein [Bacteroidales bacterium]